MRVPDHRECVRPAVGGDGWGGGRDAGATTAHSSRGSPQRHDATEERHGRGRRQRVSHRLGSLLRGRGRSLSVRVSQCPWRGKVAPLHAPSLVLALQGPELGHGRGPPGRPGLRLGVSRGRWRSALAASSSPFAAPWGGGRRGRGGAPARIAPARGSLGRPRRVAAHWRAAGALSLGTASTTPGAPLLSARPVRPAGTPRPRSRRRGPGAPRPLPPRRSPWRRRPAGGERRRDGRDVGQPLAGQNQPIRPGRPAASRPTDVRWTARRNRRGPTAAAEDRRSLRALERPGGAAGVPVSATAARAFRPSRS